LNSALAGTYANTVWEALRLHVWDEKQLVVVQRQLEQFDLVPMLANTLQCERATSLELIEQKARSTGSPAGGIKKWFVQGWLAHNLVSVSSLSLDAAKCIDLANNSISPDQVKAQERTMAAITGGIGRFHPYRILAVVAIPNYAKAIEVVARNQDLV